MSWEINRVGSWLDDNGCGRYKSLFSENMVSGEVLLELNYDMLKDMKILSVGERARIIQAIKRLRLGWVKLRQSIFLRSPLSAPLMAQSTSPLVFHPPSSASPYMNYRRFPPTPNVNRVGIDKEAILATLALNSPDGSASDCERERDNKFFSSSYMGYPEVGSDRGIHNFLLGSLLNFKFR